MRGAEECWDVDRRKTTCMYITNSSVSLTIFHGSKRCLTKN